MRLLILEDEAPAAKRLEEMLRRFRPDWTISSVQDSVKGGIRWLQENPAPDLMFLDIQLADGLSFDILAETPISSPIIFTTAFNQYMLKAFKQHSVDYLLKPIDPEELEQALDKFERLYRQPGQNPHLNLETILQTLQQPSYKERFIVKIGQQLSYVRVDEIFYFYAEDGLVYLKLGNGKKHALDYTMEQLDQLVAPKDFFRINRKCIVHIQSIRKVSPYFNSRLIIDLQPKADFQAIVSRDKVGDFKLWMDR
jgi:DNA-binding LytR/AlgR family response regulator